MLLRYLTICMCFIWSTEQITEKLYRQLEPRTKKLRFTVPFPLLAFPVYLVRSDEYNNAMHIFAHH